MTIFLSLPVLHTGPPPTGWLHSNWRPDPTVVLGVFALMAIYIYWTGSRNRNRPDADQRPVSGRQRAAFVLGCLSILIALSPPLDDWSDYFLLSAHMTQHLILMLVSAPLLLYGTPAWLLEPLTRRPTTDRVGFTLTRPLVAFVVSNALILFWHLPTVYDAALRSEPLHVFQHVAFLAAAFLAWWPVLGPLPAWPRPQPPVRCLYLFLYTIPGSLVGTFITLAQPGIYPFYKTVPRIFGISLETDQQIAGLIMWVGTGIVYLLWVTVIFLRWAAAEEAKDREPIGSRRRANPGAPESVR